MALTWQCINFWQWVTLPKALNPNSPCRVIMFVYIDFLHRLVNLSVKTLLLHSFLVQDTPRISCWTNHFFLFLDHLMLYIFRYTYSRRSFKSIVRELLVYLVLTSGNSRVMKREWLWNRMPEFRHMQNSSGGIHM